MSQLTHTVRRSPRRRWLIAGGTLALLLAFALLWIGRASADEGAPISPATSVSNVATGKADAVDAVDSNCIASFEFTDMPGMSETFSFGGTARRPVLVLFQGEWSTPTAGSTANIRLMIDGVVHSGITNAVLDHRAGGAPNEIETHGFNFVSDPLAPGTHTATIQWAGGSCVRNRSLIVLHK
jgi:hypothetical protein